MRREPPRSAVQPDLAARVAEFGGASTQLERLEQVALEVGQFRFALFLLGEIEIWAAELLEQWFDVVIFQMLPPDLRFFGRYLTFVGNTNLFFGF